MSVNMRMVFRALKDLGENVLDALVVDMLPFIC
ncbi:hypothetical protein PF005_g17936 [Phytophthora fragariae]|uniref:Uncharacterized protein n=1 Tax=Phytophthora fragariae TaxID=53985 RepID=A0A6A4CYY1_9STRA|nr:hypothetical protein PF003_g9692 [Phytophthora fragariae]KAE8931356.1 hypothetical protein PF009_g18579 [Phytophthora fragariae]KAE8996288.1 hypothetical protein PF011_g15967 [Phytophthora fragariae]KAE9087620.1 hypothetical protein PF007_g20298 [Phytophthora fragariae]KAE9094941.1 hypothetical protein PF010_g16900 [Phytophthora fragariae]